MLLPHCRSKAGKTLRHKNSHHRKIPYPHLPQGMAGYYRNFCLNFSEIAAELTNLLSKKVKFVWTDDCQLAFEQVKSLLQKSAILKRPDYEKPFKLIIDSSDVERGAVFVQEASDGLDHPVSYFSKNKKKNKKIIQRWKKKHLA